MPASQLGLRFALSVGFGVVGSRSQSHNAFDLCVAARAPRICLAQITLPASQGREIASNVNGTRMPLGTDR
jgi:DNA-binding NarL/FixJ family response regulator